MKRSFGYKSRRSRSKRVGPVTSALTVGSLALALTWSYSVGSDLDRIGGDHLAETISAQLRAHGDSSEVPRYSAKAFKTAALIPQGRYTEGFGAGKSTERVVHFLAGAEAWLGREWPFPLAASEESFRRGAFRLEASGKRGPFENGVQIRLDETASSLHPSEYVECLIQTANAGTYVARLNASKVSFSYQVDETIEEVLWQREGEDATYLYVRSDEQSIYLSADEKPRSAEAGDSPGGYQIKSPFSKAEMEIKWTLREGRSLLVSGASSQDETTAEASIE